MAAMRLTFAWEFVLLGVAALMGGYWFWAAIISVPKNERRWPAWVIGRAILALVLAVLALIRILR
jgi:hypothetical protein